MLDRFLVGGGAVAAALGLLVAIVAPQANLGPWFGPVLVFSIVLAAGGLLAIALPLVKRGRRWFGTRGTPDLIAQPTGGPSTDIRLVITNQGQRGEFHATAIIVASRNDQNPLRQGSYALMWLGRGSSTMALDKGQSHALLIATWFMHNIPQLRMGEVSVIECNGSAEREWDGFRWNVQPNERLPEFDIDVSIVGVGWSKPFQRSYTLRPSHWIGPLELVERGAEREAAS